MRFYFPWRAILAGFVTVVLVKAFMIFFLGPTGYETRMNNLLSGSTYEELAVKILSADPVSSWAAARMEDASAWIAAQ
ncbi:MAG: hypothetical protein AAGA70_12880 [Pseudomonadota bacterium]